MYPLSIVIKLIGPILWIKYDVLSLILGIYLSINYYGNIYIIFGTFEFN